jgi:hypothetical protein
MVYQNGFNREINLLPMATNIKDSEYEILGKSTGSSSTFYFLGLIPVTGTLNTEYALSQAVQKYENGQTIINLILWHETHYFFPIGKVSVVKVEGDVIRFKGLKVNK